MAFIENELSNYNLWSYILGNIYQKQDKFDGVYNDGNYGLSIACNRYYYLEELNNLSKLKLSCRDPLTNHWTKWESFPSLLWENNQYGQSGLTAAIDVHRSILPNEIVIESDYPTYEENYEASVIIGRILEHKGFIPHYYYSGNKSVHIHLMIDTILLDTFESIYSSQDFKKNFMDWLRKKIINCWDIKARTFDEDLVHASHLIRAELSKNKKGFKTFLGYSHKDMSFIPYICNEENKIYPRLGEIRLSYPHCAIDLFEEFKHSEEKKKRIRRVQRKSKCFNKIKLNNGEIRPCIKRILNTDFKKVKDGWNRAAFFLVNELKEVLGIDQARIIAIDWNNRMGNPIKQSEIEYRLKTKHYTFSDDKINLFLEEIGLPKHKHKV